MDADLAPNLQEKLTRLADKPGVYLFKDRHGEILYIGKAKVLRNRVRSYFQKNRELDVKTNRLVSKIHDLETIITDSEVEALILEANLVKENTPRYNINLKDDKSFPYIRVTHEPFPRIFPTRRVIRDGSRYFGPYTDVMSIKSLLATMKKIFPIRSCKLNLTLDNVAQKKFKICLQYHIKRCQGPCESLVSQEEYRQMIENVVAFIEGHTEKVANNITQQMLKSAESLRFEEAARLRDQLQAISIFKQKQKVVDPSLNDRDLVAVASDEEDSCGVIFKVRDGKIVGRQHFFLHGLLNESALDILTGFLKQYYVRADFIPQEIFVPMDLGDEKTVIREWLEYRAKGRVRLVFPQRGQKAKLINMCQRNAQFLLEELKLQRAKSADFVAGSVLALQRDLSLEKPPKKIEGFDISNIQGTHPVASMVCFVNGKAAKSEYRRYKIRSKQTPDDYAMMREAVSRRYARALRENLALPDLILIDGGKGQLHAALEALDSLNLCNLPVVALAKRLDEVFVPGSSEPNNIRRDSSGLRLLQRIRDESHRFAVTFHRSLRKKRTLQSALRSIPGVGAVRHDALLKYFGSLKKIALASEAELAAVTGMNKTVAKDVWHFFHPEQKIDL